MDLQWDQFIKKEMEKEYFKLLKEKLESEFNCFDVYPDKSCIYNSFTLTPFGEVKCVIIGQDPYFNPNEAHGLAFSVRNGTKIPPSLRNIYKELNSDLGIIRENGDLTDLAKKGVFLLNRVLTVQRGKPNSHKDFGWMEFTKNVIKYISENKQHVVFMLWGGEAIKLEKIIDPRHLILKAPHPSPLSSYRGFFGCKHFSLCNNYLREKGLTEIQWGENE